MAYSISCIRKRDSVAHGKASQQKLIVCDLLGRCWDGVIHEEYGVVRPLGRFCLDRLKPHQLVYEKWSCGVVAEGTVHLHDYDFASRAVPDAVCHPINFSASVFPTMCSRKSPPLPLSLIQTPQRARSACSTLAAACKLSGRVPFACSSSSASSFLFPDDIE